MSTPYFSWFIRCCWLFATGSLLQAAPSDLRGELTLQNGLFVPYEISSQRGYGLQSELRSTGVNYTTVFNDRWQLSVDVVRVNESLIYSDAQQHRFQIDPPSEFEFDVNLDWLWRDFQVSMNTVANQDISTIYLDASITYQLPRASLGFGLSSMQDPQDLSVFDADNQYDLEIFQYQNQLFQYFSLNFGPLDLGLQYDFSLKDKTSRLSEAPFSTILSPSHQELKVSLGYSPAEQNEVQLYASRLSDTCNADITKAERVIGQIYALDHAEQILGLSWIREYLELDLSYHQITGRLSTSLQTAPFGSLLSHLSGARYYLQAEGDFQYMDLRTDLTKQLSSRLIIDIDHHLYGGKGQLMGRNYIWQLFNPIMDLELRELTLHAFLMSHISLEADYAIGYDWKLMMTWQRFLPLYVDYEYTGSGSVGTQDRYSALLGSQILVSLTYSLDYSLIWR